MPAAATRGGKRLGPAVRRPLVLDAALGLFAQSGYEGTSMEALAAAAGVTKPVVYACFPDGKAGLFRALLEREEARVLGLLDRALAEAGDRDDPLSAVFEAVFAAVAEAPDPFRIVYLSPHGTDPAIARRVARARRVLEGRMAELAGRWAADDEEAQLRGRVLVAVAEAGLRLTLEEPERWPPERLAQRLAGLLGG